MNEYEVDFESLLKTNPKTSIRLQHEVFKTEYQLYVERYNNTKEIDRFKIGIFFYNSLFDQPKRKAMYMAFLERQPIQDPKCYRNALRFLSEVCTKLEFQAN